MDVSFKSLLSQVSPLASAIYKEVGNWAEAMRKAWATLKLKAQMWVAPQSFSYVKETGEVRQAVGFYGLAPESKGNGKPSGPLVVKYYDLTVNAYRSFRADRLILPQTM